MQAELREYDGSFELRGEAADMKEAAIITRIGMMAKKGCRLYVSACRDGSFVLSVSLDKARNANSHFSK